MRRSPRLLVIAGSTAPDSAASRLAAGIVREFAFLEAEITLVSLGDYPLPIFDADRSAPMPDGLAGLRAGLEASHGCFLTAPSLAGGLPAIVRNLIEWLAIARRQPAPPFAIAVAADDPGRAGATLDELGRAVALGLGATIVGSLALGRPDLAFDAKDRVDDAKLAVALQQLVRALFDAAALRADQP